MRPPPGHRVLVVDDDRDTTELTTLVLGGAGFDVLRAHSGREALESAHANAPDLILLDINMGEMDGWETLQLLRADGATSGIRVAMFSVKYDLRERLQALQLGADDYITKPFAREDLLRRVGRLLESPRPALGPAGSLVGGTEGG